MDLQYLYKLLRQHEGFEAKVYLDTTGNITIGYGRNLQANPLTLAEWDVVLPSGISTKQADKLMQNEITYTIRWLSSFDWWNNLSSNRQIAMVDMGYNLGPGRFAKFTSMLRALENSDYSAAAAAMKESLWFDQVGSRAVDDIDLMIKG
jgi:lysozyme